MDDVIEKKVLRELLAQREKELQDLVTAANQQIAIYQAVINELKGLIERAGESA